MALRHSAFYSPYLLTMAGGYLKNAGFDVNYTVQTADNLVHDRLLDGSCHVSQSAVAASFNSLESNQPDSIRHFAQINSRDGFFIASRLKEKEFNWDRLIGKKVLVDHFFQPMAMFKYALFRKNVNWSDIDVIDAGNVDEIDARFRNGLGDYVHQQGPAPQQLEADGLASVVASVGEAIGPVAFSSLSATEEWLNTDTASVFFNIYKQALGECQKNDARDIAKKLQDYGFLNNINFNTLCETIKTYQTLGCWNHDGHINMTEYNTLLDVFEYNQLIKHRYKSKDIIMRI